MRPSGNSILFGCIRRPQFPSSPFYSSRSRPSRTVTRRRLHKIYGKSHIPTILAERAPYLDSHAYRAAAEVFPARTNDYALNELIDWTKVPNDPIFQLLFPQPAMLTSDELGSLKEALATPNISKPQLRAKVEDIRAALNPHPAGQKDENVPILDGKEVEGMQHKYQETVLFFPSEGQFCHSYCTYCFRWAQFTSVGSNQQFQSRKPYMLKEYLVRHPKVQDVLFTGGDPMVMSSENLKRYITPLLNDLPTLNTIRIGTKSLCFWPYRYLTDSDSKEILVLFETIVKSGKHLSIQAHFTHPVELQTPTVQKAIREIRMTGAQIRCQGPLIRNINDSATIWREMWNLQTKAGMIPYYLFCERDTGASRYFSVPLHETYQIFYDAYSTLSGTSRTVRGPSMSTSPGKVVIVGIEEIAGERVFLLKFIQARNPDWTRRVFFAKFDPDAVWLNDLKPAFDEQKWFYEDDYAEITRRTLAGGGSSGQMDFPLTTSPNLVDSSLPSTLQQ